VLAGISGKSDWQRERERERERKMSSWRISRLAKSERIIDKRKMAVKKNWWWMKTFGRTRDQQRPRIIDIQEAS
jgi:hypothetical protein